MERYSHWRELKDIAWTMKHGHRHAIVWPTYLYVLPIVLCVAYEAVCTWFMWRLVHMVAPLSQVLTHGPYYVLLAYYPVFIGQCLRSRRGR